MGQAQQQKFQGSIKVSMLPKIYILDDDLQFAELLSEVARSAGWLTEHKQSASEFLKMSLPENTVLVLDLNMPEMDGIEVIRALAEKNIKVLLILISGFDSRVLHSAQQLAEAHHFKVITCLSKPIPVKEFTTVLEQTLPFVGGSTKQATANKSIPLDELEQAIEQHQLVLHYQPQINIKTGKLEGMESLVRWQHPQRGLIYPNDFIDLAEKNNLIDRLTDEVIRLAVEQNKKWQSVGFNVPISINVSAQNITSLHLPEQLKDLTDKHAVTAENITFELTETAVMSQLTSSLDVLNRLRMKGFSLSIDDFGTGYSSLTHLYQAPFTELKIDQKFIMKMTSDTEALVIVKICIMLGQMLGMKIVAEGVETLEIWNELQNFGCDVAQGFLIAKPMTADNIYEWSKHIDKKEWLNK